MIQLETETRLIDLGSSNILQLLDELYTFFMVDGYLYLVGGIR